MKKNEFMDLLNYYFRDSDKNDLKGILEDCEEQFRLGAKKGLSEEEVCCKLGHPKNIYRYYIGEPIVPEENPRMPDDEPPAGYVAEEPPAPRAPQFYDWEKDPEHTRRPVGSAYTPPPPPRQYGSPPGYGDYDAPRRRYRQQDDDDLTWESGSVLPKETTKAIASPFLDIFGVLCSIASTILFFAFAFSLLASLVIYSLPPYIFSDLLPLPTLSVSTMAFFVLSVLFAALTMSYVSQACHKTARQARSMKGGSN